MITTGTMQEITVKRIGEAYFITVPTGAGAKRLYLTESQMQEIWDKVGATLSNPARYSINGHTSSRESAKLR